MTLSLEPITLSSEQRGRLTPYLKSWGTLAPHIRDGDFTLDALRRLVAIESEGQRRPYILDRLLQKFRSKLRDSQSDALGLPMRESKIEKAVIKYAEDCGFTSYKFTSPGRRGVPDQLMISPNGDVLFVEFKQRGKKLRHDQQEVRTDLVKRGCLCYVIDSIDKGKEMINDHIDKEAA